MIRSKEISNVLEVSRLSFAPAELMEQILGTQIGAATVFSALQDSAKAVHITGAQQPQCCRVPVFCAIVWKSV